MSTMSYKGYKAQIIYSEEDDTFIGNVLDIQDIVGFDGNSVAELKAAFAETMEFYFESCAHFGGEPNQPQKTRRTRRPVAEKMPEKAL
jgi:predicted HicB family RNase H-like nuclease